MNNKGQVLVMFLILLPVILVLFAFIIDKCYLLYQENSQKQIGDIVCSYALDSNKTDSDIKQLALENDSKLKNIEITRNDNLVSITLEKNIDSIFGRIFSFTEYKIKTNTKCGE